MCRSPMARSMCEKALGLAIRLTQANPAQEHAGSVPIERPRFATGHNFSELAERSRTANERVRSLLDPRTPLPLIERAVPMGLEQVLGGGVVPSGLEKATIIARVVPFTRPPRFQGWATTSKAAAAALAAGEALAGRKGFSHDWIDPDPSGAAVTRLPVDPPKLPRSLAHDGVSATANIVLDGAGVSAAALRFGVTDDEPSAVRLDDLANELIAPTIKAAVSVLAEGEFLGRAHCQLDMLQLSKAFTPDEARGRPARSWVPTGGEIAVPLDPGQRDGLARRAANAYGRSAGAPTWD